MKKGGEGQPVARIDPGLGECQAFLIRAARLSQGLISTKPRPGVGHWVRKPGAFQSELLQAWIADGA